MKHTLPLCLVLTAFLLAPAVCITQPKIRSKPLVAVMPFKVESRNKVSVDEDPASIRTLWTKELAKSSKVRVLTPKQVDARLRAKSLVWKQTLDAAKLKRYGRALGVKYLVIGTVADLDEAVAGNDVGSNQRRVSIKTSLNATATGEAVFSDGVTGESNQSRDLHRNASNQLREKMEQMDLAAEARAPAKKADGQPCTSAGQCAGGACRAATCYTPASKAFGQSCNFNAECRVGKCSAELFGLINGSCVCNEDWHCGTENYCNKGIAGIGSNDCRPKLDRGRLCTKDHQCKSNRCAITCR